MIVDDLAAAVSEYGIQIGSGGLFRLLAYGMLPTETALVMHLGSDVVIFVNLNVRCFVQWLLHREQNSRERYFTEREPLDTLKSYKEQEHQPSRTTLISNLLANNLGSTRNEVLQSRRI